MVLRLREPARLINSRSTDEFTRGLLESAEFDQPSAQAVRNAPARVAARMHALKTIDRDLVVTTHVSEVHPSTKLHTLRPETKRITRAAAVGILLGTSLAAAVVGARHSSVFVKAPPVASISTRPVSASVRRARPASVREAAVQTTPTPVPTSFSQSHEVKPTKLAANDLGQELALLDAAKAALSSGNPQAALAALDSAARLPRRALVPEATVLRVKALVASHRTAQALALVKSFVTQSPNSPVNPVLRDLVAPFEKQ